MLISFTPFWTRLNMIVIFLLLFYISQSSTIAFPFIDTHSDTFAWHRSTFSSVEPPLHSCPEQRSFLDITWSCLATIFACTWVSVHPDIPDPDEKWWIIAAQRVELVAWTLLTPELIILWGIKQWRGARLIAKEQEDTGWGRVHGYFMQMGGFMLYDGDQRMGTLSYPRFKELLSKGRIEFPTITQKEVEDRSKNDGLSKLIVLGQISWFILQCITRRVEKLPLTELELSTLAFAALNGFMYFFWWNKPFDVRSPVAVKLQKVKSDKNVEANIEESVACHRTHCAVEEDRLNAETNTAQSGNTTEWEGIKGLEGSALGHKSSNSNAFEEHCPHTHITLLQVITMPWKVLKMTGRRLAVIVHGSEYFSKFNDPALPSGVVGPMRVPTFYSLFTSSQDVEMPDVAMYAIGSTFGAIHCAAWFFDFPTVTELWIWRISSLYIAVYPVLGPVITVTGELLGKSNLSFRRVPSYTLLACVFLGLWLYIIARLLLLAECLTTLRDLPLGTYNVVQWTIRIPHI